VTGPTPPLSDRLAAPLTDHDSVADCPEVRLAGAAVKDAMTGDEGAGAVVGAVAGEGAGPGAGADGARSDPPPQAARATLRPTAPSRRDSAANTLMHPRTLGERVGRATIIDGPR
jgi:hypothetical protein